MAITNSEASRRPSWPRGYNKLGALAVIAQKGFRCLGLAGLFAVSWLGVSEDASNFARRAEKHYQEAQRKFQTSTKDAEAAWQFSRACFDWAEFAIDAHQREAIAVQGIAACRHLLARDLKSAPGHFYLAMNLGQLARTKTLGALKIVDEMEREFKAARELDAKLDYAGADRCLGLLYFEAPGWPASIGSKSNARRHLQRAVQLAPNYPENHLCLLEAYLKWGENRNLVRGVKITEELVPTARKEFAGEAWAPSWVDWDKRWKRIQEKAAAVK